MADPLIPNKYILSGKRILLKKLTVSDVSDAYHRWMNDPEINQYMESRFFPSSLEDLKANVEKIADSQDNFFFAILTNENRKHIGNIKLGPVNWIHRRADIGIIIGDKNSWGRGYGSDAIEAICSFAFRNLNLHKLTAGGYVSNVASYKAFKKCQFQLEGTRKCHAFCNGQYADTLLLGLINPLEIEND